MSGAEEKEGSERIHTIKHYQEMGKNKRWGQRKTEPDKCEGLKAVYI